MLISQSVPHPTGINVFGSFVLRVEPDVALVRFTVSRTDPEAARAFAATRAAVTEVRAFLAETKVPTADVQSSHVRLTNEHEYRDQRRTHIGYNASIGLTIRITELPRFEEIVGGVVEAGANGIQSTEFATTKLAEHRAEARRGAFAAARRKAKLYAEEADVRLVDVLHVEDVNPDALRGRESHGADVDLGAENAAGQVASPGSIEVKAAVVVTFAIERAQATSGFA